MSNQPPQYDPIFDMPPQQLQPGTAVYEEYVHPYGPPTQVAPGMLPERKVITLDTHEFIRTRDALTSAYVHLAGALDGAVKAYVAHTNLVIDADTTLNVSFLAQPLNQLTQTAQAAQAALQHALTSSSAAPATKPEGSDQGETKGARKKRAYKKRDPNAPKRPLTAYFRFLGQFRQEIGKELKEEAGDSKQKPGDLSKTATARWHALTKEEQQPYRDAYQKALKDYEREVARYKAAGGQLTEGEERMLARGVAAEEEEGEEDAEGEEVEEDEEDEEPAVKQAVAAAEESSSEDSDSSSSGEDSDDEEEEEVRPTPPPPPPPVQQTKTPKSSKKAGKKAATAATAAAPTPQFSRVPIPAPVSVNKSSSPERKRKAPKEPETPAVAAEEPAAKKSKKGKKGAVVAAADAEPEKVATPVVESANGNGNGKKEKKRKRKSEVAA